MNIGIDHGYYAIKTRHFSFPAGITAYSHEPYTLQNTLEYGGKFFVCGTGRQPILRNKMENENYYLLTLAAIAKEIQQRGAKTECSVTIAAGLPLAGFGREKKSFREYLRPSSQPVSFQFEGIPYKEDAAGMPYPTATACAHYSCKVEQTVDLGTHLLFVGLAEESEILTEDEPLTYSYYRNVIKGLTPKGAPSYQAKK